MAALAIEEALQGLDKDQWRRMALLLCVAEPERPRRTAGLDDQLFTQLQNELGVSFASPSALVPHGRVGVAVALSQARALLGEGRVPGVLIVGADSLLSWPTLSHYEREDRLLTESNSHGFMPGEGAGALWVRPAEGRLAQLLCIGVGFGRESAHISRCPATRSVRCRWRAHGCQREGIPSAAVWEGQHHFDEGRKGNHRRLVRCKSIQWGKPRQARVRACGLQRSEAKLPIIGYWFPEGFVPCGL
jgi:hypothetical protein